jgi:hypothetical protein
MTRRRRIIAVLTARYLADAEAFARYLRAGCRNCPWRSAS